MTNWIYLNYLLHLELDGSLQLFALGSDVITVHEWSREFTGLVKTTTKNLLKLLDDGV